MKVLLVKTKTVNIHIILIENLAKMDNLSCYQLHAMYIENVTMITEDKIAENSDLLSLNRQIYLVSGNQIKLKLIHLGSVKPLFFGMLNVAVNLK